jgi:hypothetical protein
MLTFLVSGLWFLGSALPAVWADEPSNAALRSEIEMLKDRLAGLERQVAQGEFRGVSGIGEKPVATMELPSGLQGLGLSGYVDVSYLYNFAESDGGASRGNRGRAFDTEPNGFTPHAAELVLEKPSSDAFPFGFRTDLFFGDDASVIKAGGLGLAGEDVDVQQLYITAKAPFAEGLEFKLGKFVTLLGAEVIESPANWNFSRSYMFLYSIPFTHTGALASYPIGEWGSVTAGVVNGWDVVDDTNKGKSLLGNITLTPMKDVTFSTNLVTGPERTADNRNDRTVLDLVASWKPTEPLTLMANYDYGHESNLAQGGGRPTPTAGTAGFDSADWQGLALYAKYDLSPTWALAGRWEWFDDKDNVRTVFTGPGGTTDLLDDIDFYEYTLTSQWTLYEHVLARLEYRHDKADEKVFFRDADGFTNYQDTVAAELVYHF